MSEIAAGPRPTPFRPSFATVMTGLMACGVFGGFGMTYWGPLVNGSFPAAPPVVHLHALVFTAWILLLLAQPLLVAVGKVAVHRSVGTFGIALATLVIATGLLITLLGAAGDRDTPAGNYYDGMYLGCMAVSGFGLLFTLAIRQVRQPAVHRRLMLLATLPLLPPAVHRLYMVPLQLAYFPILPMYLTLDALALAILLEEWRSSGRLGVPTLLGVGWLLLQQLAHPLVVDSAWFAAWTYDVSGLVHYR